MTGGTPILGNLQLQQFAIENCQQVDLPMLNGDTWDMDGADGARSLGVADNRRRTRCRWGKFQHRSCELSPVPYHALPGPIFVNTLWIPTIVPALCCCTKKTGNGHHVLANWPTKSCIFACSARITTPKRSKSKCCEFRDRNPQKSYVWPKYNSSITWTQWYNCHATSIEVMVIKVIQTISQLYHQYGWCFTPIGLVPVTSWPTIINNNLQQ